MLIWDREVLANTPLHVSVVEHDYWLTFSSDCQHISRPVHVEVPLRVSFMLENTASVLFLLFRAGLADVERWCVSYVETAPTPLQNVNFVFVG